MSDNMGTFILKSNEQMIQGIPIGKLNALDKRVKALENDDLNDVNSVSNSDGTLTISPTTGAVVASLNLANANTWTAKQTFRAGTASAATAPLYLQSGTNMTSPEAGAVEYTTDDLFFTIATGAARKRITFADPVGGLTSGRVPYVTTNGRLTDSSALTFSGSAMVITSTASEKFRLAYDGASYTKFLQNSGSGFSIQPFASSSQFFYCLNAAGSTIFSTDATNVRMSVGHGTPSSTLHVQSTTEQLRIGYGSSFALKFTVNSINATTVTPIANTTSSWNYTNAAGTSVFNIDSQNQRIGIGNNAPSVTFHITSGTTQQRTAYDASNYFDTIVSSDGSININGVGSNSKFQYNKQVDVNNIFNVNYGGAASVAAARILLTADTANATTAVALDASSNGAIGRLIASSSVQRWKTANIRTLQTSTAGYTVDDVDVTETSTGSGAKLFANWKIGGSSRFTVSTRGEVYAYYDASNYWSAIVSSAGAVTFDAVGASAGFTFSDEVTVPAFTATGAISITDGANKNVGVSAAMTAGTITINNTRVTASSRIFLTHATLGGVQGILSVGTIVANTSFIINSSNALDTGTVNWFIIN